MNQLAISDHVPHSSCKRWRPQTIFKLSYPFIISALYLAISSVAALAAPTPKPQASRLAVLDFRDDAKLPPFEVASLADSVRGAALNTPFVVMTKENMLALLPPETKLEECVGECEVEVGRKLGAHYLITGQVGQIDGQLQLLLRLYETLGGSLRGQSTITASSVGVTCFGV